MHFSKRRPRSPTPLVGYQDPAPWRRRPGSSFRSRAFGAVPFAHLLPRPWLSFLARYFFWRNPTWRRLTSSRAPSERSSSILLTNPSGSSPTQTSTGL